MEVTGLAVGVAGLAGLFSVCLDSLSRFQSYRESNSEIHVLDTRFRAARARFEQWGVGVGISNGRLQPDHHRGLDNKERANLIESILEIISKTICDESILQRTRTVNGIQSGQFGGLSQSRGKRLKWALAGKESRNEQINIFEKLVQQLYNLIPLEDKSQDYEALGSAAWVNDIRQMLTQIEQGIKFEEKRDVLSWLGKSTPNDKYEDSLAKRVDTTCEWILERPIFKSWLSPAESTKPSVLWINRPAGFGKTVLCAHIVRHLSEALDTPVAHFFFTSDHESREDPFSALRSWQRQVSTKANDAFECIRRAWENDLSEQASRRTLVDLFKQMMAAVPGCVFVADGLDECSQLSNGDSSVSRFLKDIANAIGGTDVRLLLVSRDEPEIRKALGEHKGTLSEYKIGTNDVQADTAAFSQSVVNRTLCGKSEDLQLAISEAMTDRCQGQFLWIKMQEQSLRTTMSKKRLYEVLKNTPSGLDRLYDQNWSRIMNMSDQDRDRTFALLRWTAFTFGRFCIHAVVEAALIDQFGELDPDDYPENVDEYYVTNEILGLCGPLVEVHDDLGNTSPGSRTLHIPHFSVRQYLLQHLPAPLWMQPKDIINMERERVHHTVIARACVQYMSSPKVWEEGYFCSKAFLIYASFVWMSHARLGFMDPSLRDLSKAFLNSNNTCFRALVKYFRDQTYSSLTPWSIYQPQISPLQLVFADRWIDMADHLFGDADVNEIGAFGRTPIFSACESGSVESVNRLIQRGADLSITDADGYTCLHEAAYHGFEDIVRTLVESNVDLSPQNKYGTTPLHLAARTGKITCYHLATEHVYKVDSPLMLVTCNGDIDMAKVLFEFGAVSSLFTPNCHGELPLQIAAASDNIELVELFLEHGTARILSIPDTDGNTALHLACSGAGHDKIMSLFLRPGVEESILMKNNEGNTPVHVASKEGFSSYIKSILEYSEPGHQCLLEIQNQWLETPLYLASSLGNIAAVRELLNFGARTTLSARNERGETPLFIAAYKGYTEVIKALLEHGAENTLDIFDVCNISPLWASSFVGSSETPLHAAAINNGIKALNLLLEVPGISVNQKTTYGFSPLFIASRNGYLSMVESLLSVDSVDKGSKSWLGLSPLFAAVANGHLEVTKLLLSSSKEVHVRDRVSIDRDLLWWAQRSNKTELIQLLETHEALAGTASNSFNSLPGPFKSVEPLPRDMEKTRFARLNCFVLRPVQTGRWERHRLLEAVASVASVM
ncbi:ankyrin [Fusarium coicis]|nr:ankyrin [Fusarium coicis]